MTLPSLDADSVGGRRGTELASESAPRRLILEEHATRFAVPLEPREVDALLASPAQLTLRPSSGAPGRYEVRPASRVGMISIGNLAVEIRPKVSVSRLLYLLGFGLHHARWSSSRVAAGETRDLCEAMVEIFAQLLETALRRGLLQGYRTYEDALPGVRGRIRFDDQLRSRFGVAPPVEVRFDDYTEDIEANRVLKAALFVLQHVARSQRSAGIIRRLLQPLQRVSLAEYAPGRIPTIPIDRLNAHYEPALRFAALILEGTSVDLSHGDKTSVSILFDMNQVFESFVRRSLRSELGLDARAFPSPERAPSLTLDEADQVRLKPDLSWWQQRRCVFVGDAKYKRLKLAGFLHGDLYQMLAYLTATGLAEGLLVYAQGEDVPASHVVRGTGRRIHVQVLELDGKQDELTERVRELASIVTRIKCSQPGTPQDF